MKTATFLFTLLFSANTLAQECSTIENGKIKVTVTNKKNLGEHSGKIKSPNPILLFANDFNDSTIIYLNDSIIYKGFLKTGFSSGITDVKIPLQIANSKKKYVVRVELIEKHECVSFIPKTKYKAIWLYRTKNWKINYTNYRIMVE